MAANDGKQIVNMLYHAGEETAWNNLWLFRDC